MNNRSLLVEQQRALVVAEVRSWIGTPYHHEGDVKGVGVDCGMILVRSFVDTGMIEPFDPRPYSHDWNVHNSDPKYLDIVSHLGHELPRDSIPLPGDVVVWWHGRSFSHGSIVTGNPSGDPGWPWLVHSFAQSKTVEECDYRMTPLETFGGVKRPYRIFSLWGR